VRMSKQETRFLPFPPGKEEQEATICKIGPENA